MTYEEEPTPKLDWTPTQPDWRESKGRCYIYETYNQNGSRVKEHICFCRGRCKTFWREGDSIFYQKDEDSIIYKLPC